MGRVRIRTMKRRDEEGRPSTMGQIYAAPYRSVRWKGRLEWDGEMG